jgi:putative ABC transport system permease protein
VLRVGSHGLRARPLRVVLSALGIAIGIAAMVAVVGISTSSRAELNRLLDALGTNLLTAGPGSTLFGDTATLPDEAVAMVGRIGPVESVSATGKIADAKVYRSDKIPPAQSGGIASLAARTDLPDVVGATVASGTWLNDATAQYPAVVLGAKAAEHLGIGAARPDLQIWLGGQWATVVGTLNPVPLAPELDQAALVGWQAGQRYLGFDGSPTTIYTRTHPDMVETVRGVLAATANPAQPNEVEVSPPWTRSPPKPPPTSPSPGSCSAWAPSPCWSAGSG